MDARYRLGHRPGRRRRTRVLIVLLVAFVIIGIIVALIVADLRHNQAKPVSTKGQTVVQAADDTIEKLVVDKPEFTMELPGDWKEIAHQATAREHSITWQATRQHEDNRYLKIFIDTIPATQSVNRLVPISILSGSLSIGDISDNCATFTQGGTQNAGVAQHLTDAPAKWHGVDFICDLARITDNEVGAGSTDGINTIAIKGAQGTHRYFFLYTDRNIHPDYTIFYNALKSFSAK